MKRLENSIFVILIFSLLSCETAKDYKATIINASLNPKLGSFSISLLGKNRRLFQGRIIVEGIELSSFQLLSSPNPDFLNVTFAVKDIADLAAFDTLMLFNKLPIDIILFNNAKEIRIDTTISFPFIRPPVITSLFVTEPKQLNGVINLYSESDFIRNLIRNGGHMIDNPKSSSLATILTDTTQTFKVSLKVDSTYDKTIITSWPSTKSRIYNYPDIQSAIIEYAKKYEGIETDSKNNTVQKNVRMRYSGLNDIFLISFNSKDEFVIVKLFEAAVDNIKPVFSDRRKFFDGNPEFEGYVFLRARDFFGYSPYKVPFTGSVYGDIKQILIEGVPIQFVAGEDIYTRQTLDLDDGYNRIAVTVIDKRGNRTKGFIEIAIEQMADEKVRIENNIDIDNN